MQVHNITRIRDTLSPHTMLDIDEAGVILPDDNTPGAPMFPLVYWNAAGAMYAYLFGRLATTGELGVLPLTSLSSASFLCYDISLFSGQLSFYQCTLSF